MKRWLILLVLLLASACSLQPEVVAPPTPNEPTNFVTIVPIPTLLPTATVAVPAVEPPTELPKPTNAPPTGQKSAPPAQLPAPVQVSPQPTASFHDGNDIRFTYQSVGKLEPNQCYLLHVEMAVPGMANGNRGDEFLDTANCGDPGPAGKELSFVLYRGKFTNSPNYGTMLSQVQALAPDTRKMNMTWVVRVVQNNGLGADGVHYNTVPLSPNSPVIEFEFLP